MLRISSPDSFILPCNIWITLWTQNFTVSRYNGDLSSSIVGLAMEGSSISSAFKGRKRNYFGKFRLVFKLLGMSLESNKSIAYKIYSFVVFIPLFLYPSVRVLDQILVKNDTSAIYEKVLLPYSTLVISLKSVVFLRKRVKLAKLLDKLEREPFLPNPNRGNEVEEERLQKNCMQIIKIQSIIYVATAAFFATAIAAEELITRIISEDYHDWQFPYRQITLLNVTHSPNFELWWFYENFSIYFLSIHFVIIDTIIAAVLTYLAFQFKMLQNNIRQIMKMSYNEMLKETGNFQDSDGAYIVDASMVPWKYLKKFLIQSIHYHLAILNVADETEEVLNGLLLFLFVNTLGLLGVLVGYATSVTRGGTVVVAGQLLVSCFWGQQVMHESQEVGRVAFETNFVGADLRFQKSLALIIRRSQKAVVITTGKFAGVCLATFTWILRAGYTASTVLRQVK